MKVRDKRLSAATKMPPLHHNIPGRKFDITNSEVAQWLIQQPEIMQHIFETVKNKEIKYNPETGTWQGVGYHGN